MSDSIIYKWATHYRFKYELVIHYRQQASWTVSTSPHAALSVLEESRRVHVRDTWLIYMCDMTHYAHIRLWRYKHTYVRVFLACTYVRTGRPPILHHCNTHCGTHCNTLQGTLQRTTVLSILPPHAYCIVAPQPVVIIANDIIFIAATKLSPTLLHSRRVCSCTFASFCLVPASFCVFVCLSVSLSMSLAVCRCLWLTG